jgi:antitoxin CcdA
MCALYDQNAPKKLISLSLNSDLLKKAKDLEINISAVLEQALISQLKIKQAQQWQEKNKSAIAAYNKSIVESGTFSDGLRSF